MRRRGSANRVVGLYPGGWYPGRHWVYMCGTADGILKVGRSIHPSSRILAHRSTFKNVAWYHIGPCGDHAFAHRAEYLLITRLADIGQRIRRTETFTGIDRSTAFNVLRPIAAEVRKYARKAA